MSDEGSRTTPAWWTSVKRHPVLTTTLVLCTLVGATAGLHLLTEEWSAARRIAAGAVGGLGTGFLFTFTKMIG